MAAHCSAQNLIPNPGFETYSACPSGIAQMNRATGWNNPTSHSGSADYHHVCATDPWVQVPNNVFGNETPHGGNAYMGLALFYQSTPSFREYIYCQLTPPLGLTAGQTYQISWFVSAGENSSRATDDLQFYVSAAAPTWVGNWNPMTTYTPQAAIPSGTFLSNKTGWIQVSATFTASGGQRYLTIGNFLSDGATTTIANGGGAYNTGYIYLDDGVLQPAVVLSADLENLNAVENEAFVTVSWETNSEITTDLFEIERSIGGYDHFEKIGENKAAGNSSEKLIYTFQDNGYSHGTLNYYRLKVLDQNGEASYSNAVGVETTPKGEQFVNFFPNPAPVGSAVGFTFACDQPQKVNAILMDLQGKVVRSQTFEAQIGSNHFELDTKNLPAGQFLMRVQSGTKLEVRRVTLL
jgi:hypothetical protein